MDPTPSRNPLEPLQISEDDTLDFDLFKHEYCRLKDKWNELAEWYHELSEWERFLYQQSRHRPTRWVPKETTNKKKRFK